MKSIIFILLFLPMQFYGQNPERISFRMNLNYPIQIEGFEKTCINDADIHYAFRKPTFLGNYNSSDIDLAIRIKPKLPHLAFEFILRNSAMKFNGGEYYSNLNYNLITPGVGLMYINPFSKNLTLAGYFNFYCGFARLTRDANMRNIFYNEFTYLIRHDAIDLKFIVPIIEPGIEFEYQVSAMLGIQTRVGMTFSSFPDFDVESPLFYKSLLISAGIKYIIFRNKKFSYQ